MAATTKLIVWNAALREIAAMPLADTTTVTTTQQALNGAWDHAVEHLLARVDWNFARRRTTLSAVADAGMPPYRVKFTKPSDYLRKCWLKLDAGDEFQIEHAEIGALFYAYTPYALMEYISDHADSYDPANWPPHFTRALTLYLASLVAPRIARAGADDLGRLQAQFNDSVREAEAIEQAHLVNSQIPAEQLPIMRRALEMLAQELPSTIALQSQADKLRWQMSRAWINAVLWTLEQGHWTHAEKRIVFTGLDLPRGQRQPPPELAGQVPILPVDITTPGKAVVSRSVVDYAMEDFASQWLPGTIYVKPSTGSDSNPGTRTAPVLTLNRALRTLPGSTVVIDEPCTLEVSDFRLTDASNILAPDPSIKRITTIHPVTITVAGPALSAQTFTAHGSIADAWETTLTLTVAQSIHRLMRTDQTDSEGQPQELFKAAAASDLSAVTSGWHITTTSGDKVLTVKMGTGVSVETNKSRLKANYLTSAGTARMFALGVGLVIDGPITLDGVQILGVAPTSAASNHATIWAHGIKVYRPPATGVSSEYGNAYMQNCIIHSSQNDGFNNVSGSQSFDNRWMIDINCRITGAGARDTFGTSIPQNRNAVSAHGGLHHVAIGSVYGQSHGPDCADTGTAGFDSVSWLVGCQSLGPSASGNLGFLFAGPVGGGGTRTAYIDSLTGTTGTSDAGVRYTAFTSYNPLDHIKAANPWHQQYRYRWKLPNDWIAKQRFYRNATAQDLEPDYVVVDGYLYSDNGLLADYISKDGIAPAKFSASFAEVVAARLAATVSPELVMVDGPKGAKIDAPQIRDKLEQKLMFLLRQARGFTASQMAPHKIPAGSFVRSRRGGSFTGRMS